MKNLERQFKALANRRRLAILKYLKQNREATVGAISDNINLSFKSTSRHLSVLAAADMVDREQRSLEVYYRLSSVLHPAARHAISIL